MDFLVFDREDYFRESDCLISLIKSDINDNYHEIFTNLIIIDLVINLETFIERTLESYINKLQILNLKSSILHESIRREHLKKLFSDALEYSKHEHKLDKFNNLIQDISRCMTDQILDQIHVDLKLGMGKHGEKELENLFKKIGFSNIYDTILIPVEVESMLDEIEYLDIENFIQTLTSKRNLAIHQGVSLHTTFSIEKLESFSKNLETFLNYINDLLNFSLHYYKNSLQEVEASNSSDIAA